MTFMPRPLYPHERRPLGQPKPPGPSVLRMAEGAFFGGTAAALLGLAPLLGIVLGVGLAIAEDPPVRRRLRYPPEQ